MSALSPRILQFPASTAKVDAAVHSKPYHPNNCLVSPQTGGRIVKLSPSVHGRPLKRHYLPNCGWSECIIGLLVALGLHLIWPAILPISEKTEPVISSAPIMVEWISSPQSRVVTAKPKAKKIQKSPKRVVQPKAKLRKPTPVKSRPLLLTSDIRSGTVVPQTPDMAQIETPKIPVAESVSPASVAASVPVTHSPVNAAPLTLPHLNADYLHNPAPAYPSFSRKRGEQGKVMMRAMINHDGAVAQLTLHKSSGFNRLDRAALEAVKNWRFVPARRGDQVVPAWVVVPISFILEK